MVKKALIVCHKDADGLLSASLAIKSLHEKGIEVDVFCTSHLLLKDLKETLNEKYDAYYFLDIGSQKEQNIAKHFNNATIIDHHPPGISKNSQLKNIKVINAYHENIDGSKEITATGLSFYYFFTPSFHQYYYIPAAAAHADAQPFIGANKRFLTNAILRNQIREETGVSLFGYSTKPISKSLEYFFDEINANENAVVLLKKLKIKPSKKIKELTQKEEIKLATYLAMKGYIAKIIDKRYLIHNIYEMKEYISLINAAVKLNEINKALKFVLTEKNHGEMYELYELYRKRIKNYMNLAKEHAIQKNEHIVISYIPIDEEAITGTLATILANKHYFNKIVCVCTDYKNHIKFSLRYVGNKKINLGEKIRNLKAYLNIDGSGHENAAGGIIAKKDLEKFIASLSP